MSSTNIKHVSIPNIAWENSADLYFPPNFDKSKKYPAVVSAHPIGSCKEQTSGNVYGKAVAEAGYVVCAFDASFQGASGGQPRFVENPEFRVSDFRYVVDYLQSLDYIDPERIAVLGICGGGGYAINAAITDYRFKACVGIVPANYGRITRELFGNFDPVASLENMAKKRTEWARGAKPEPQQFLPPTVEDAKKMTTDHDIIGATDYYKTDRGRKPGGATTNLPSHSSAAPAWDAFNHAEVLMTRPLLVIAGSIPGAYGSYRDASEIYGRAASKVKQIEIIEGKDHYQLYDDPEATGKALEKVIPFLAANL